MSTAVTRSRPVTDVLVLLSGGQDSTTSLFWAKGSYPEARIHALTAFYAQRHESEVAAATSIVDLAGVASHRIVDLTGALGRSDSALLARNADHEISSDGGLRDDQAPGGLPTSFVPGRNLVFLAVAGAHAGAIGATRIVTGVCQTDYSGYPDCRDAFIRAMEVAIDQAMPTERRPIYVDTPLMNATKADTVAMMVAYAKAEQRRDPDKASDWRMTNAWNALRMSITCYLGKRPGCGDCPSCVLRRKGFADAGTADPHDALAQLDTPTVRP